MPQNDPTVEYRLSHWGADDMASQKMSAAILQINDFRDIRIPSDRGGPDGGKDIVCFRDGKKYIGACHFSAEGEKLTFSFVKGKFLGDLEGVAKNSAQGFIFFVNTRLKEAEQKELTLLATAAVDVHIYDLSRLKTQLGMPHGYSIRADFLGIQMTPEENVGALFSLSQQQRKDFIALLSLPFSAYYQKAFVESPQSPLLQNLTPEMRTYFVSGSAAMQSAILQIDPKK